MIVSIEYEVRKVLDLPCRETIEGTVLAVLDYKGCPYEAGINAILTDSDTVQEISREHRQIDTPMDMLSFPMVDYESPSSFNHVEETAEDYFNPETGELILGDTVISVDKVEEQTEEYGHSQTKELTFLTTHSMFRLFGYNHMGDDEWLVVEGRQKEILEVRGYTR